MRHRTQYHRCKAYAEKWAAAQAAAYRRPVSSMMLTRWVGRCHRANLDGGSPSGWRGPLVIDLTKEPADAAADVAQDARKLNQALRSCSAALWLCELVARPQSVRSLGRQYHPDDCKPVMVDAGYMLRDEGIYNWVYEYACNLAFLYSESHEAPHKTEKVLEQVYRLITRDGVPTVRK